MRSLFSKLVRTRYDVEAKALHSEELAEFFDLAGSYDEWFKQAYKDNAEDAAEQYTGWEDLNAEEREDVIHQWVKDAEENEDSTMVFFRNPKILPPGSWVVHLTEKDPRQFYKNLKGCGPNNLGLTKHYGCSPGDLVFGFSLRRMDGRRDHSTYGSNAVLVQVDEAVEAEHISDGWDGAPFQTVFDKGQIKQSFAILKAKSGNKYEVYDGQTLLFTQNRTEDAFTRIVKRLKTSK